MIVTRSSAADGRRPYATRYGLVFNFRSGAVVGLLLALLPAMAIAVPEKWAPAIAQFAAADLQAPPTPGGVLFVGSSSIRRWETLAEDFPRLPVINRGFGGSELTDSVYYFETLVVPHAPKIVVLYAGENDLASGATPVEVAAAFQTFCEKLHTALPATRLIFVSIKPSPKRWHLHPQITQANALIKAECARDARLSFVDVYSPMLDESGELRPDLFVDDGVHMTRDGYRLWTWLLAPTLAASSTTVVTK